jgi:hypothetical protein
MTDLLEAVLTDAPNGTDDDDDDHDLKSKLKRTYMPHALHQYLTAQEKSTCLGREDAPCLGGKVVHLSLSR